MEIRLIGVSIGKGAEVDFAARVFIQMGIGGNGERELNG